MKMDFSSIIMSIILKLYITFYYICICIEFIEIMDRQLIKNVNLYFLGDKYLLLQKMLRNKRHATSFSCD